MTILIVLLSVVIPVGMLLLEWRGGRWKRYFDAAAVLAAVIAGNIAAISVYQIIRDNAVFMTTIHGIFLNPFLLAAGGYLGVYYIYYLLRRFTDNSK